jgi:hypothetical protein
MRTRILFLLGLRGICSSVRFADIYRDERYRKMQILVRYVFQSLHFIAARRTPGRKKMHDDDPSPFGP